ncbi:hypothetical protein GCM10025857_25680 [Alicyclobacillus contaminans]|uniref:TVP38/TMEM64 family protein n=1 Tax=Alicyclobacillus contaminans TaxID=392016 RepID=UPI0004060F81|nr:TVP38/TMEM64 family protein [Alicyclobacillus contaminans]GMA51211.1 hypothetical protein GCM10025857_25680 [Alicyclobacillus contaminans]
MQTMKRPPLRRWWLGALIIAICAVLILHMSTVHRLVSSIQDLQQWIRQSGPFGPLLTIGLLALHGIVWIPSELVMVSNLALFGPWMGTLYSWIGGMMCAHLSFWMARTWARPLAIRWVPRAAMDKLDHITSRYGVTGLLLMRLIPFVAYSAVNYGAGLTNIPLRHFTWTTAVGLLPFEVILALAYTGISHRHSSLWFWVFAVGATIGVTWMVRRRHRR